MNQIVNRIFTTLGAANVSVNVQQTQTLVPLAGAIGINPSQSLPCHLLALSTMTL
jgi:hypothetical protein